MTRLNNLEKQVVQRIRSLPKELRSPIVISKEPFELMADNEDSGVERAVEMDRIEKEANAKLALLKEYYMIPIEDNNGTKKLLMKLLPELIPGFQVVFEEKKGRQRDWSDDLLTVLFCDVQRLLLEEGAKDDSDACAKLIGLWPWDEFLAKNCMKKEARTDKETAKILQDHYIKAKKLMLPQFLSTVQKTARKEEYVKHLADIGNKAFVAHFVYGAQKDEIIIN